MKKNKREPEDEKDGRYRGRQKNAILRNETI